MIPKWAFDRAFELARERGHGDVPCSAMDAFAHYIAEHEEPPVDPLLVEAREIAAAATEADPVRSSYSPDSYRRGERDGDLGVKAIVTALKRGMELAREVQP